MSSIKTFIACTFGPRLYSFYKLTGHTISTRTPDVLSTTHKYSANKLETISDSIIRLTRIIVQFSPYFSIVFFSYVLYRRQIDSIIDWESTLKHFLTAFVIFASTYCIRGYGRYTNKEYLEFLKVLDESKKNLSISNKRLLVHFDFDFYAHPIDFSWHEGSKISPPSPYKSSFPVGFSKYETKTSLSNSVFKSMVSLIGRIIMNTVGKRIVYPGSISALQALMQPAISAGREKLIQEQHGTRYKLLSYTGDHIDSLFIDRRDSTLNGDYLVIGCEGNGGFYEVGTILTPLEVGYSVLGWNHPGFGGSTGFPYPDNEVAAVDTVIRFAVDKLKFPRDKIIIYGWSIGGFTATWAGMRYPDLYALVIDASFDHIIPIATKVVPGFIGSIAEVVIEENFDLNNSRHLENYKGPVLLIRRSQDEVISLDPYNPTTTNRGNNLLIDLMEQRYPALMDDRGVRVVKDFLAGNSRHQDIVLQKYSANSDACMGLLSIYKADSTKLDDTQRDRLVLFLASRHLLEYDSVHCAPLPPRYFEILHSRVKKLFEIIHVVSRL